MEKCKDISRKLYFRSADCEMEIESEAFRKGTSRLKWPIELLLSYL